MIDLSKIESKEVLNLIARVCRNPDHSWTVYPCTGVVQAYKIEDKELARYVSWLIERNDPVKERSAERIGIYFGVAFSLLAILVCSFLTPRFVDDASDAKLFFGSCMILAFYILMFGLVPFGLWRNRRVKGQFLTAFPRARPLGRRVELGKISLADFLVIRAGRLRLWIGIGGLVLAFGNIYLVYNEILGRQAIGSGFGPGYTFILEPAYGPIMLAIFVLPSIFFGSGSIQILWAWYQIKRLEPILGKGFTVRHLAEWRINRN